MKTQAVTDADQRLFPQFLLDLTIAGGLGASGVHARIVMMGGYSSEAAEILDSGVFDARSVKHFTMQDLSLALG